MRLSIDPLQLGAARSGRLTLPDGRVLEYAEWGAPDGAPVIHLHGVPGSRLELHASVATYRDLGIRLVTFDRPGYGGSTPQPGRRILDVAADVEALAGHLGLGQFGITAISGGGPFALACALRLPDRLTGVALAGCLADLSRPGAYTGMKLLNRLGLWMAAHAEVALRLAYGVLRRVLQWSPDFFVYWMTRGKPGPDLQLIDAPDIHRQIEDMLAEAVRGGVLGAVQEVRLLARPWGFAPESIQAPVHLWHGDRDDTAPLAHAFRLDAELVSAELTVCPGEGHMVMWTHLAEIMSTAAGRHRLESRTGWPA